MSLKVEKFALTTQTYGVPLICTMKKYTRVAQSLENDPNAPGIILLLGHGAGICKETWEPTICEVYKLDVNRSTGPIIREVWGLDYQNHGEVAILNEGTLFRNEGIPTIWSYGDAFATLVKSGLLGELNPSMPNIVLCGHSAAAAAVVLSTSYFNPPSRMPISKLILEWQVKKWEKRNLRCLSWLKHEHQSEEIYGYCFIEHGLFHILKGCDIVIRLSNRAVTVCKTC